MNRGSNRDVRLLWLGQAGSQLGNRVHQLAVAWWVMQEMGSAALMGAMLVASSLPTILFGPLAGPLADRLNRRQLMLACDAVCALLVLVTAMLAWRHLLPIPLLFVLEFVLATMGAVFTPAALSIVPEVVDEASVMKANSLQEMTTQGAGIVGPALGGLLVAALGAPLAFVLNALSFVASALALGGMRWQPGKRPPSPETYWQSLRGGFGLLRERPAIASLLGAFAIANLFLAPIPVLLPVFAKNTLCVGAGGLGMMHGALGIGMVVAALFLSRKGNVGRKIPLIAASFVVQGLCMLGMGMQPALFAFLPGLFVPARR